MEYRAKPGAGVWATLVIGIVVFGLCFWGIDYSLGPEDRVLRLMLQVPAYLLLAIFTYVLIGAFTMSFQLTEKALKIHWGGSTTLIPWQEVTEVIKVVGTSNLCCILGVDWPGYKVGLYMAKGLGPIRMYASNPEQGFLYVKSNKGFIGLTPPKEIREEILQYIAGQSQKEIEIVDMEEMPSEIKGKIKSDDYFYNMLYYINLFMLLMFGIYLALFFPGSGATRLMILFLVLAIAIFFFNTSNAARLYQFSPNGGYIILSLGILINGMFFILSLSEMSF